MITNFKNIYEKYNAFQNKEINDPRIITPLFIENELMPKLRKFVPIETDGIIDVKASLDKVKEGDSELAYAIRIAGQLNRGTFVKQQTKNAKYGSLTPLLMLAVKETLGLSYSSWSREDIPSIKLVLGKSLSVLADLPRDVYVRDYLDLRGKLLETTKSGVATTVSPTSHLNKSSLFMFGDEPIEVFGYPRRILTFIYNQLWLANADIRLPEVMILDINDWDNVPDAIDMSIPKDETPSSIKIASKSEPELEW